MEIHRNLVQDTARESTGPGRRGPMLRCRTVREVPGRSGGFTLVEFEGDAKV